MSLPRSLFVDTATLPVRMRMRADLHCQRQLFLGETYWVIKDPLSVKFFRLTEEEYAILRLLDENRSLVDVKNELSRSFPNKSISVKEIQQMLGTLHRSGLILSGAIEQGSQLYKRQQDAFHQRLLQKSMNLLWIRFRGVDPERFLNATYPLVRWLFHPALLVLWTGVMLVAGGLVTINFHEFQQQLPTFHEFFSLRNAFLLTVSVAVTKILHELAHAYACKHFGCECHEIGFLLLIMVPCLYCNTSDAWRLPSKWRRAAIGAAGMFVELTLAAVCTLLWWYSRPGFFHYLCLNVMFTSSVSTLVFNGNPLLRYDGYYILSDLAEMPNLASRSRSALLSAARKFVLGMPSGIQNVLPRRHASFFVCYALASTIYRWFVLLSILFILTAIFEPYGLRPLGELLIALTLVTSVAVPFWKAVKFFFVPGRIQQMKSKNVFLSGTLAIATVLVFALVPMPSRVYTPVEMKLVDSVAVYVASGGTLQDSIETAAPKTVRQGEVIARLSNRQLELEVAKVERQLVTSRSQLRLMQRTQHQDDASRAIPALEQSIRDLSTTLDKRKRDLKQLSLKATRDGVFFASSPRRPSQPDGALSQWSGTALARSNQGCYLTTGELLGQIGEASQFEAVVVIPQESIKYIQVGQQVDIKLDEYPGENLVGIIEDVAHMNLQIAPRGMSQETGGDLVTKSGLSGSQRPMTVSYEGRVCIENHDLRLVPGFRGQAKIHTPHRTLASQANQLLHQVFYLR